MTPASVFAFTQVDKFLPLYQRKKVLQEQRPPPVVFEMIPSSGMLSPGERVNVQIKFSPVEGVKDLTDLAQCIAEQHDITWVTACMKWWKHVV